jgi:uncharacterized ParB-like nuclease family protein
LGFDHENGQGDGGEQRHQGQFFGFHGCHRLSRSKHNRFPGKSKDFGKSVRYFPGLPARSSRFFPAPSL